MNWILDFLRNAFRAYKKEEISDRFFSKNFFDQVKKQVTETPWINRRRSERLTTVEGRTVQWNMKKMFLRVAHAGGEDAGRNRI